jgi:hypothetical protein
MTAMSKRKPPKNLRPYATPSGKKARMVELTDPHEIQALFRGGLDAPHLVINHRGTYTDAAQLAKWRASQTTSGDKP